MGLAREDIWANTQAVGEWLVRALDLPGAGDTVLELSPRVSGDTGFQAARRVGDAGRVLITDFAPAMVAVARRRAAELDITNAEFRVLDAERMDLATDSVDDVVCRWGYMLMIDRRRRLRRDAPGAAAGVGGWPSRCLPLPSTTRGLRSSVASW